MALLAYQMSMLQEVPEGTVVPETRNISLLKTLKDFVSHCEGLIQKARLYSPWQV